MRGGSRSGCLGGWFAGEYLFGGGVGCGGGCGEGCGVGCFGCCCDAGPRGSCWCFGAELIIGSVGTVPAGEAGLRARPR